MDTRCERQLLTFLLGDQECAVDVSAVHEIRTYETPAKIAGLPDFIPGIINLRGAIIPLFDVRRKLRLSATTPTPFTATIILSAQDRTIGAVVDRVSEVVTVDAESLEKPAFGDAALDYVDGVAMMSDRLIVAIDFDRLVDMTDVRFLDASRLAAKTAVGA